MNVGRTLSVLLLALCAGPAFAQSERYELGSRMRAFEAAWETADAAGRARALSVLPDATTQFLSLQFREAGRTLDRARFRLQHEGEAPLSRQWRDALGFAPESRLVDGAKKELTLKIQPLYDIKGPLPKNLELRFWFVNDDVVTLRPEKFPATVKVPLPPLGEFAGLDRRLFVSIEAGKEKSLRGLTISQVKDLSARLAAIQRVSKEWPALDTIEKATVRDRHELLAELAGGTIPETDLPAAALLANAETMLDGKPFFTSEKPGEFWMSLPLGGKKTIPVRVLVPKGLPAGKPVPLVVALHGAGGSENLFFEGYGAGRIVAECRSRGWVLVAPRSGLSFLSSPPVGEVVKEIGQRFPVDAKRTFILGHSMGAAQTVDLIQKHPGRFAGAAILGGGGRVRQPEAFANLPVFIGVGEKDFARSAAKRTAETLTAAGAKGVVLKEYPGVEHMVIVREVLPAAFAMFDAAAKR